MSGELSPENFYQPNFWRFFGAQQTCRKVGKVKVNEAFISFSNSYRLGRLFSASGGNMSCVPGSINSHYFHIIGDGHQPNSRVYIPIVRIPIKGGMTIPNNYSDF